MMMDGDGAAEDEVVSRQTPKCQARETDLNAERDGSKCRASWLEDVRLGGASLCDTVCSFARFDTSTSSASHQTCGNPPTRPLMPCNAIFLT
jgi:hypothetical protein